ncbi:hypothetical protein ACLOJK_008514 [Asimina triloba]
MMPDLFVAVDWWAMDGFAVGGRDGLSVMELLNFGFRLAAMELLNFGYGFAVMGWPLAIAEAAVGEKGEALDLMGLVVSIADFDRPK